MVKCDYAVRFLLVMLCFGRLTIAREPWTTSKFFGTPEPPPPYKLERVFPKLKFKDPVDACPIPGTDRFLVMELNGKVFSFGPDQATPDLLLDIRKMHPELDMAYGMTLDPGFLTNRLMYLCYAYKADISDGSKVSRIRLATSTPPAMDQNSEEVLITWRSGGHNGGCLKFGPDGYLYISTGDGAGPNPPDPLNTGQDNSDLLSCILRIDVARSDSAKKYRVPADNPFLTSGRPEIWAYGFRNPWRMSFDRVNGDLWVGDVGWELWELVFRIEKGGNYGWSVVEGRQSIKPESNRGPTPILPPVLDLPHSEAASITGGYVYHGKKLPELIGAYVFGDWATGKMWALRYDGSKVTSLQELASTGVQIISFAEDHDGELLVVDYSGVFHELKRIAVTDLSASFPRKLSETGLFASVSRHELSRGVVPFTVNATAWADRAETERFLGLTNDSVIQVQNNSLQFPSNAVLAKTFRLGSTGSTAAKGRPIETQVLHYDGSSWRGYSYRWNAAGTDADLVESSGIDEDLAVEGASDKQTWHYASRAECVRCHNSWAGYAISFNLAQLNTEDGQLAKLIREKVLMTKGDVPKVAPFPNPKDQRLSMDDRARAYLHINCSHCHRDGAGGSVPLHMLYGAKLSELKLVNVAPHQGTFGLTNPHIITPGDPYASSLYYRVLTTGPGRMPRIGSSVVDSEGVELLHQWISQLQPRSAPVRILDAQWPQSTSASLAVLRQVDSKIIPPQEADILVKKGVESSNPQVRDLFERFVPKDQRVQRLGAVIKPEQILALKGNSAKGKEVFFSDAGPLCKRCHQINGEGLDFGPDLSAIGRKLDRAQILESILFPSKLVEPAYVNYSVETMDELSYTGFVVTKTADEVVIKDQNRQQVRISAKKIRQLQAQQLSAMPELLLQGLTAQSVADLVEFLGSLK